MSTIPWNHFPFIGYVIGVSMAFLIVFMDSLMFFCTMTAVLPIFVRSWREKIRTYSILMLVLGLMLFLFGVLTITEKHTEKEICSFMTMMWNNLKYMATSTAKLEETEQFWDDVQMQYKCCGLNSTHNYNTTVPESCCADDVKPCTVDSAYRTYCYDAVKGYHENVLVIVLATVAFTLSLVCLILIVLAQFSKRICGLPNVVENVSVL